MADSRFVALEGIDKTGKTLLQGILETKVSDGVFVSDPTELPPWDEIFINGPHLHQFTGTGSEERTPGIAHSFVFLAARLHCYNAEIRPALEHCQLVVADRFSDSWLAYQSVYQEEFFADGSDPLEYFQRIHKHCCEAGLLQTPDLTVLITVEEEELKSRLRSTDDPTEYERSPEKLLRVQERYRDLMAADPDRFHEVEDTGQGVIDVYEEIEEVLAEKGIL